VVADVPSRVWAVDFQFDSTTDGRPIKIVSIIDEHTRECLGGMIQRSITGEDLITELARLAPSAAQSRRCCVVTTDPN
jgi:putative transposase